MLAEPQPMTYVLRAITRRGRLSRNRREETMKHLRSSRQLIKMWHRREKATIDHLTRGTADAEAAYAASPHSAFTPSGLAIEAQVRKAWQQSPGGVAIF